MKEIRNWWLRTFRVISTDRARDLNLVPFRNIYVDEINQLNYRSIWEDSKYRQYRVRELANIPSSKPIIGIKYASLDNDGNLIFLRFYE